MDGDPFCKQANMWKHTKNSSTLKFKPSNQGMQRSVLLEFIHHRRLYVVYTSWQIIIITNFT